MPRLDWPPTGRQSAVIRGEKHDCFARPRQPDAPLGSESDDGCHAAPDGHCTGSRRRRRSDATVNIGSLYEPQNLDNTAGAGQGINEAFNGNVYEALFRLNDDGSVSPSLVKDFKVSDDGLTYTFALQPGVTFHSGDPLTSADVKWSIERVTSADSKSSRKNSLKPIASIETPDDATVVVKLSSRSISLPYNLSYVWVINDKAKDLQSTEDGTGPYALEGWQRGSQLAVKRFDKYWGPKPENGEVVFKYFTEATALNNALLTGAVDVITSVQSPDSLAQFKDNPDFNVAEASRPPS